MTPPGHLLFLLLLQVAASQATAGLGSNPQVPAPDVGLCPCRSWQAWWLQMRPCPS
ncbi:hypothetical protein LEMLEM_LOCUS19088 [Lemmus lemmus]